MITEGHVRTGPRGGPDDPSRGTVLGGGLCLELTERCNNDCVHCYINQPDETSVRDRELPTEGVQRVLREAAELGCLDVTMTGGEPLLRDDFAAIYECARRLGMRVRLLTNATLLTTETVELLVRVSPLQKVEVTLYGMEQGSYEAVSRVPGSFAAAWRGIERLLVAEIPFIVKGVRLPPTASEQVAFGTWASSLPGMDGPPQVALFFDLRARRDSEARNRTIQSFRAPPEEGARLLGRRPDSARLDAQRMLAGRRELPGPRLFKCDAGHGSACLDAYGVLQPCMLLRHPDTVYELTRGSLEAAFRDFFPRMRRMEAEHAAYLARCARCFVKPLCDQCPAKSWMEHGTLDTPVEMLCAVTHAVARHLGLLGDGEQSWEVRDWRERIETMISSD